MAAKPRLRPVLDGDFWLIGPNPPLAELYPHGQTAKGSDGLPLHECVDHHLFQSLDGAWHLWGCIRKTPVGRVLYHWEGTSLTRGPWRPTGEMFRADRKAGESVSEPNDEEKLQSPFVVREGGLYYLFYGGGGAGIDEHGNPCPYTDPRMAYAMCLATSPDGRAWIRYRNPQGQSRLFVGPGATRDACLIKIAGLWHLYYAGYHNHDPLEAGFYCRTSADLVHWSDWRLVHQDRRYGSERWNTECPHVVYRAGYYYLFRTVHYSSANTHVFRSEDPFDFGIGDARAQYVGPIAVAAPEIIVDGEGNEYITSNHDLRLGTQICKLIWKEDEEAMQ